MTVFAAACDAGTHFAVASALEHVDIGIDTAIALLKKRIKSPFATSISRMVDAR